MSMPAPASDRQTAWPTAPLPPVTRAARRAEWEVSEVVMPRFYLPIGCLIRFAAGPTRRNEVDVADHIDTLTFGRMLRSVAKDHAASDALVFPEQALRYSELLDVAEERSRQLRSLGVGRGDHVGVLMPNSIELIELLAGAALIGAVTVPINTRFKVAEIGHVCRDAELVTLFTTDSIDEHVDFKQLLWEALPGLAHAPDPAALSLADTPRLRSVVLVGERDAPGMLAAPALRQLARGFEDARDEARPDDPLL